MLVCGISGYIDHMGVGHTPKLNALGGHWTICQRMAITLGKNKKVKSIRYFMDGAEYVYSSNECEFVKA